MDKKTEDIYKKRLAKAELVFAQNYNARKYFFEHIDHEWIDVLNKYFTTKMLPDVVEEKLQVKIPTWIEGEYLLRVVDQVPDKVLDILSSINTSKTANSPVQEVYIRILTKLLNYTVPETKINLLIKRIGTEGWATSKYPIFISYILVPLIKELIEKRKVKVLSNLLVNILKPTKKIIKGALGEEFKAIPYFSTYEYQLILNTLDNLPNNKEFILPIIQTLKHRLGESLNIEFEEKDDNSYLWRPMIENNNPAFSIEDIKDMLIDKIVFLLNKAGKELNRDDLELVIDYKEYSTFERIKINFYRTFPEIYEEEIKNILISRFGEIEIWHEYQLLIRDHFNLLTKTDKESIWEKIDNIIEIGERARHLDPIKKYLSEKQKEKYSEELSINLTVPADLLVGFPQFFSGPSSPAKVEELEKKSIEEIVKYIISFEPPDSFMSASHEGLARNIQKDFENRYEEYITNFSLFDNPNIRPTYFSNLFLGISNVAKEKQFSWANILPIFTDLIISYQESTLPEFTMRSDRLETNWQGVFISLLKALQHGLNAESIDMKYENQVWNIISTLLNYPDLDRRIETKYIKGGQDPFGLAINTTKGTAFDTLFSYIWWYSSKKKISNRTVPTKVRSKLIKLLNSHTTRTVRAVYGRYFSWLYYYDKDLCMELKPRLFFISNTEKKQAALENYLNMQIFKDVFPLMEDVYKQAIDEQKINLQKNRYGPDINQGLATHVLIAYVNKLSPNSKKLKDLLIQKADESIKKYSIDFLGRGYIRNDESKPLSKAVIENLKEFWDERINAVKAGTEDSDELAAFGWWIRVDIFDNKWMLDKLLETTRLTKKIDFDYNVLKELASLVEIYPKLCLEIILNILKTDEGSQLILYREALLQKIFKKAEKIKGREVTEEIRNWLVSQGYEVYRS